MQGKRKANSVLLFAIALALIGQSVWMEAKARLAQVLLARAWQERVAGTSEPKPWPWADTWPVALLRGNLGFVLRESCSGHSVQIMAEIDSLVLQPLENGFEPLVRLMAGPS